MAPTGNKKVANGLVALSSAAIVAVYSAGFLRTKAAAEKLDAADHGRRPMIPSPANAGETSTPAPIEPPADHAPVVTNAAAPAVVSPSPAKGEAAPKVAAEPVREQVGAEPKAKATVSSVGSQNVEPGTAPVQEQNPPNLPNQPNPSNLKTPDEAPTAAPAGLLMPKEKYKDGTYTGWGTCRHGDIQATVTIEGGRITAASISQCWTRYSCSWVANLPGQIVARQSPDCDYVTGATQSANAFYWAVVDALNKAK